MEFSNYFWNWWNLPEGTPAKSANPNAFTHPAINTNPATKGKIADTAATADAAASASPDARDDPSSSANPIWKKNNNLYVFKIYNYSIPLASDEPTNTAAAGHQVQSE